MSNNNKTPAIRFKGFTDTWEQRKLGECAEFNPKSELPDIFEYVDLESVVGTDILSHRTESKSSAPSRAQRLAQKGDVFYQTVRPYQKNNCIFENDENNWVFSTGYAQLRPVNDGYFLLTLLQNEDFVKLVLDRCTGTSYPAINSNDLADIDVNIPINNLEQQRIGDYFRNLDSLITLHQRKYDKLTKVKKAMLKKMFPQNGANKPEIRFRGFTDGWEHCKLNSIADVRDGTHASPQYFSSGHPFITSKNVKDGYINYDDVQYISDEDYEEINKRSKVDVNDILMGMIGTIGNLALIREEPDFAIKNVALIKDTGDIFYLYLYHYLQSETVLNQLLENMDGGTQKFVALKRIRELNIAFPIKSEQQAIGTYFHNLDSVITLHQRKCDKYKSIKAGLIRKLFP
ncbi:restriction endonuclease subunit S [Ruminococcus sp.]|jgi:type I restriction enzyme S subunit|uniref:restriction endonuclease subunit S n=1 Tax=Ruminococcus sp. TaxID=41978 RepID=UPI00266D9920|nr:restriction endonuclease subunit S [uncultured Ruminococcus sp.]